MGISANIAANYELQGEHIATSLRKRWHAAHDRRANQEAQDDWCRIIRETAIDNTQFDMECTPGYYNNEGGAAKGSGHIWASRTGPVLRLW
ncbi:putative Phenylacetone monooxygenase domain protein [Mycobacterium kansasii]|uniref:Putative Phenylacetone monooxygenase domain protein n=1 Tax=Mycobacterium kansasii TaxID=1768 RepID=A0A1V3W8V3_MYCKA|nr:putative Phenylacetone monooxygenase domain protein [Mycobacterium kansasii]